MGDGFLIVDIITILAGLVMIVSPRWVYYAGRRKDGPPPPEPSKNWPIISRILGVFFIFAGCFFIYLTRGA